MQAIFVPINDIHVDLGWNIRNVHDLTSSSSDTDDESAGFDGLVASLRAKGQITPVDIRATVRDFYCATEKPYSLVTGFRRVTAIARIYAEGAEVPGLQAGYVRAIDRGVLSEREAFELNALENGHRNSLGPPDTCLQIKRGRALGYSNAQLAELLGKDKKVIERYGKVNELPDDVRRHWREGGEFNGKEYPKRADGRPGRLSIDKMLVISRKVGEGVQVEAYDRALSAAVARATVVREAGGAQRADLLAKEIEHAERMGAFLGHLAQVGVIKTSLEEPNGFERHEFRLRLASARPTEKLRRMESYEARLARAWREGYKNGRRCADPDEKGRDEPCSLDVRGELQDEDGR